MKIRIGCDIVKISRFDNIKKKTLERIFHKNEIKKSKMNPETLAGIFAAKESCKKVFNDINWHDIEIKKKRNGKPLLILGKDKGVASSDLSISHDGDYAIASVVFLIREVQ
ncbi:holo-ACP synthase [Candidatus Woesearchaeota archaeon]|nr:holo-ACP synthase [Candidatus Woesearchaeota archaeon]